MSKANYVIRFLINGNAQIPQEIKTPCLNVRLPKTKVISDARSCIRQHLKDKGYTDLSGYKLLSVKQIWDSTNP